MAAPYTRQIPTAAIAAVGICAFLAATGCTTSSAVGTVENPSASQLVAPPGFGDSPLWSVPFVSRPHVVDDGFVGVLDTAASSDSVTVQVISDTGAARFGVDVPKNRAQFAVTTAHDRELLITEDVDPTDSGHAASLTARDTRTGEVVWGPVGTDGCLTGDGLLIDAGCSGESAPPEAAISAADGHTTDLSGAVSESGGYAVVRDGDTARIVTVDTGNTAWSTETVAPPPAALAGSARFVQAAGNSVVVAWTIPTRPEPIQAVYRLSDAEIRWVSGARTPMAVMADASGGSTMITTGDLDDDGIAVLFRQYGTRGFTADRFPDADRFTLVGGIVYGASDSTVTAIEAVTGRVTGTSPGPVPVAMTHNGVALAADTDGYTAFKVIPHF
ncbi:hypothetical protein [Rhodococcus sp. 14-1411-2a]|uniref:hypothetical protein n=1 Tax=Rhodococcus sp. 14-1411-2a TaxID=2023151 RepID=UPI00211AF73B|nr:hypothetical protein [Rhodococcus sp. 14-1411-2a]